MKIKLATDSSCDVSMDFIKKHNLSLIPLSIVLNDLEYFDMVEISPKQIFEFVEKTNKLPKTSAVSINSFKEFFNKELENADEIIYIGIGGPLSCTHSNAVKAAEEIGSKKIHIIDSSSLSTGTTLLILYAEDLIKTNKYSATEIVKKINERIPFVQASFVVDTLDYLYKGGRCSALAMFGANLLKIKPKLQLENGKIISNGKYRGKMLPVYIKYIDDTLLKFKNPDTTRCFITHANADIEYVNAIVEYVKQQNIFEEILISVANGTITSHCGKGTLGILYINDGGKKS